MVEKKYSTWVTAFGLSLFIWIKEVVATEECYGDNTTTNNGENIVVGKNEGNVDKVHADDEQESGPTNSSDDKVDQEETSSDTTTITMNTDSSDEKQPSTADMKDKENNAGNNRLCPDLAMTDSDTEGSQ